MQADVFSEKVTALGRRMRADAGPADIGHLRGISGLGRVCGTVGFLTAPFALNPVSIGLLALGLMARFVVGHAVGHGAYDRIPGVPPRYTRRHFARGWRRVLDWPDWWTREDWDHTHNRVHHRHTQAPDDADVMDPAFMARRPLWARFAALALLALSWKFAYYAPACGGTASARTASARNGRPGTASRSATWPTFATRSRPVSGPGDTCPT